VLARKVVLDLSVCQFILQRGTAEQQFWSTNLW